MKQIFSVSDSDDKVDLVIHGDEQSLAFALLTAYRNNPQARDVLDEFIELLLVADFPMDESLYPSKS